MQSPRSVPKLLGNVSRKLPVVQASLSSLLLCCSVGANARGRLSLPQAPSINKESQRGREREREIHIFRT